MVRLLRCFLFLGFFFASTAYSSDVLKTITNTLTKTLSKEWIPLPRDCLNSVLSEIAGNKKLISKERIKLESAAHYNDQIFVKFKEVQAEKWEKKIASTIDHYAAYDLDFDPVSFKKWLKETPIKPEPNSTIGSYLKNQSEAFYKKYPKGKIEDVVHTITEDLKIIAKDCGKNIACNEQKIAATFEKNHSKLCFMKAENRKSAFKSMVTGLAFANAGYAMTTAQDPNHDFPYDLTATNLIWTPIMTEIGCRSTLGNNNIGSKIELNKPIYRSTEWWARAGNKYISYMILSPASDATYVGFHTLKQIYLDKDLNWEDVHLLDLSKQVVSLSAWDAIWPAPRMVVITDPLYLKGIPGMSKYLGKNWLNMGSTIPTYAADWGSRLGLSYINSKGINWWVKKSDDWFDTKFHPNTKETPAHSSQPSNPNSQSIKNEDHDTIPTFK